jgi:hypothetical protein
MTVFLPLDQVLSKRIRYLLAVLLEDLMQMSKSNLLVEL